MDHPQDHLAEHDLLTVFERIVLVLRLGGGMDRDRDPVLEREPTVPGDVIGMRVRLERADDADVLLLGRRHVLLDRVGGIDDHRLVLPFVADEVGRAAEVVVDELSEDHRFDRNTRRGLFS